MGTNRWTDIAQRTRNKRGDEVSEVDKGDASSRLAASKGPAEDEVRREVVERLRERENGFLSVGAGR